MEDLDLKNTLQKHGFSKPCRITRADGTVIDELRFSLNGGGESVLFVPASIGPKPLLKRLIDRDALLPAEDVKELLHAACDLIPEARKRYADSSGWDEARRTFVAQEAIYGHVDDGDLGMEWSAPSDRGRLKTSGTWQKWRDQVAAPAVQSSMLVTCLCAAFAAPLLTAVNEQNFGLNVFGVSRTGKTLGTTIAASAIGLGTSEDLPVWDASDIGFEQLFGCFNDMLVPIDDIETVNKKGRARASRIERLAYKLASGQPRAVQHHYERETAGARSPWRCVLLTSSEKAIADPSFGVQRQKGAMVRLIDVPAVLIGNDIFDQLETSTEEARADRRAAAFTTMFEACKAQHGAAFKRYIEFLAGRSETLESEVRMFVGEFSANVRRDIDSDITRDVARKFGLMYAGGKLAISSGIVDWGVNQVFLRLERSYRGARALLPDEARDASGGMDLLLRELKALPHARRLRKLSDAEFERAATVGFRTSGADRQFHCYIRYERFNALFNGPRQRDAVIEKLKQLGRVELATSARKAGADTGRLKQQHSWPRQIKRVRSLHISWPVAKRNKGSAAN